MIKMSKDNWSQRQNNNNNNNKLNPCQNEALTQDFGGIEESEFYLKLIIILWPSSGQHRHKSFNKKKRRTAGCFYKIIKQYICIVENEFQSS